MTRNLSAPRLRWRPYNPMRDHDALPPPLRAWATQAALPWSARSLLRAWNRSLVTTGSLEAAIRYLERLEAMVLAGQASKVWGEGYPCPAPPPVAKARSRKSALLRR
ncbi:MAG: DUF6525 family protein [Tabrizicola sp.]